ncbi:hypothetical protein BJ912DRAFT_985124 [Pholiota molesta]|nr:hypothetical protein BJ912DRAFT_985124 [Pholiota molesta]
MASANAHANAVSLPSGSNNAPAAGSNEAHQMEADVRDSPMRAAQASVHFASDASSPPTGRPSSATAQHEIVEQELIPSTSRLSRLPNTVPSSPNTHPSLADPVAISAFQNNNNIYGSQDVHHFVNSSAFTPSTDPRTFGQPSNLETHVSSASQPLTQHVLTHPIRRPSRTSNQIFQSSSDLAAHYGIPQILPPAPRTHPTDNSMAAPSTSTTATITPAELESPVIPSDEQSSSLRDLEDMFGKRIALRPLYQDFLTHHGPDTASPEFRDNDDFMAFFTPQMPELDDFGTSPLRPLCGLPQTPPVDGVSRRTASLWWTDYYKHDDVSAQPKESQAQSLTVNQPLYTISPNTPNLDSFEATPASTTTTRTLPLRHHPSTTARSSTPAPARITPDALLDEEAPTQPRKYTTPSATSRKEVPAVFQRKRSRSTAFGDEEDQLDELPLNPTEKDLIEQKRRQNTVAARRSRKRKLEQFQKLQSELDEERRVKEIWKTRALTMLSTLQSMGLPYSNFPPTSSNITRSREETSRRQ